MSIESAREATKLFLRSVSFERRERGLPHSFMFGAPGSPRWSHNSGTEVYYEPDSLIEAILYVRRHGSPHVRRVALERLSAQFKTFFAENFGILAREVWGQGSAQGSLIDHLSEDAMEAFAEALSKSGLFIEPRLTALFPISVIRVCEPFEAEPFFLAAPRELAARLRLKESERQLLVPDSFPPYREWEGRREKPASWLGVHAPTTDVARQMRAAILGAVALLPHRLERYMFTGRRLVGGYCVPDEGWTITFGDPHTPPLSEDVEIGQPDQAWLKTLASKLTSPNNEHRRQMRSLEYFYRAWVPDAARRFAPLCGALDALFGDASRATAAVAEAVGPTVGATYDQTRLRKLLGLRASVIHGGAPNVYESSKYGEYYELYREDAVRDLELIVARCLQAVVFDGQLRERPHTYAEAIRARTGIEP